MGKPTGFLEYERENDLEIAPLERIKNFNEFHIPLPLEKQQPAGSTLYGMRSAVLPVRKDDQRHGIRLSAEQPLARNGMILSIPETGKRLTTV